MLNSLLLRYVTLDTCLLYEFRETMTKFFILIKFTESCPNNFLLSVLPDLCLHLLV